jgi:hypothetical protein
MRNSKDLASSFSVSRGHFEPPSVRTQVPCQPTNCLRELARALGPAETVKKVLDQKELANPDTYKGSSEASRCFHQSGLVRLLSMTQRRAAVRRRIH